ncbi:hypothetical protein [Enterovibrio calviensis]|uniref:hypothetical protein n=1 Tax=Enterovibrio calviensis TaxID=91359 RepID=UPI00068573C8|nr:hypothetical protein [Enterovibrio calviensis]
MKKLYRAYSELQEMIKKRDTEGLKAAWSLSSREKTMADGYGSTPDEIFNAIGIESKYERYKDIIFEPIGEWADFKLVTYAGRRLVRLENARGHSPLRVSSDELDAITSFTPYFSIIDGRVVTSR